MKNLFVLIFLPTSLLAATIPPPATTSFTRNVLLATDPQTAATALGFYTTNVYPVSLTLNAGTNIALSRVGTNVYITAPLTGTNVIGSNALAKGSIGTNELSAAVMASLGKSPTVVLLTYPAMSTDALISSGHPWGSDKSTWYYGKNGDGIYHDWAYWQIPLVSANVTLATTLLMTNNSTVAPRFVFQRWIGNTKSDDIAVDVATTTYTSDTLISTNKVLTGTNGVLVVGFFLNGTVAITNNVGFNGLIVTFQ